MVRNPKDMIVSYYHFAKSLKNKNTEPIESMIRKFAEGEYIYGPWWEHVDQYLNLANVHVVQYETLLEV